RSTRAGAPPSRSAAAPSGSIASALALRQRLPGLLLGALVWLLPPAVLPTPSRSGEEGPPRPLGREPALGAPLRPGPAIAGAQDELMLYGPFPAGTLVRGVSEGVLLLAGDEATRRLTLARIRETGASVVRIPVDWRETVAAAPPPQF